MKLELEDPVVRVKFTTTEEDGSTYTDALFFPLSDYSEMDGEGVRQACLQRVADVHKQMVGAVKKRAAQDVVDKALAAAAVAELEAAVALEVDVKPKG